LVDVGGGFGGTLAAILAAFPALQGVVFDLPAVADAAAALAAAGLAGRCRAEGGDMRRAVPRGGDAYLLKWVLMDQSDEQAIDVLRNCAEAMTDGGRVLAVEMTMPSDKRPSFARVMDLQMMLLFDGGRIRMEEELCGVFGAAGLEVVRVLSAPPSPKLRGVALHPAHDRRMRHRQAALGHHLHQVTQTELEPKIPAHA
jgi:cyclopropane fatty-acyl-phospholipid synthase-like methyltransferase